MLHTDQIQHFKGINGLRAFAALSVVVFHINHSLHLFGLPRGPELNLAGFGVSIFFSISGFLITYLLIKEKSITANVNIRSFYMRRILRIWPLYFIVLLTSLITAWNIQKDSLPGTLPFYVAFLANVPFVLGTSLPFLGHFWSIAIEEQFYLFWPWIIRQSKNILKAVTLFTVVYVSLRILFRTVEIVYGYELLYLYIHVSRFDCMSIGAIGAILLHSGNPWFLKFTTNKIIQLLSWAPILLLSGNSFHIASVIDHEIMAMVTVVLMVNVSINDRSLVKLDNRFFNFLGNISYGIYMIHPLVIFFYSLILISLNVPESIRYIMTYIGVLALTILFAHLSYRYIESPFLRLKDKYKLNPATT